MQYNVVKVLNNNVLQIEKDDVQMIAIGKGIGFNRKKDEKIDSFTEDTKMFYITEDQKYKNNINMDEIEEKLDIIIDEISKELNVNEKSYFSLLQDHLLLAIERIKLGFSFENPFNDEIKIIYSKEYLIADKIAKSIDEKLDVTFSENEKSFLTLHLYSITSYTPVNRTLKEIRLLNEATKNVSTLCGLPQNGVDINDKVILYSLKELVFKDYSFDKIDAAFNQFIKNKFYEYYEISKTVITKLYENLDMEVNENVISLFTLDIYRFATYKRALTTQSNM